MEHGFHYGVHFGGQYRQFATFEGAQLFKQLASRQYDASELEVTCNYGEVEIWSYSPDGDFSELEEYTEEDLEYDLETFFGPKE